MKVQNAVVGMEVQVKHDCRGHSGEFLEEGLVCTVGKVMGRNYELRLLNPVIDMGFAWVNASDVRKYIPETPEEVVETVPDEPIEGTFKVGTKVLVGSLGAGFCHVDTKYAGLVCTVVDDHPNPECVQISHPDVRLGAAYSTFKKYLSIPVSTCTELTIEDTTVGDYVVCSTRASHLTVGVAYRVVGYTGWGTLLISNPHPIQKPWAEGYAVEPKFFNKVLREVNNAEARVAQSGSESTCRSE